MSLIFTRKDDDNGYRFKAVSGVLCGDKFQHTCVCDEGEDEKCYGAVDEVYDVDMDDAISYLGITRGKPHDEGFAFINKLWLKRAIHAGLLHGCIYETGNYFFSLYELDKLRENILAYDGIDPLNKTVVADYTANHVAVPKCRDDYGVRFFECVFASEIHTHYLLDEGKNLLNGEKATKETIMTLKKMALRM